MSSRERLARIALDGLHLTLEDIVQVARAGHQISLIEPGTEVYDRITESRAWVDYAVERNAELAREGQPARAYYGINTGFGIHAAGRPMTDPERTRQASRKLIMSHATG